MKGEFLVNDMGDLSLYLGCAFERDKMEGVIKMTQTAFVDSLVGRLIYSETQNPTSVEFDLGPKRINWKGGDWPYKQAVGSLLWISGMTRPDMASAVRVVTRHAQSGRAALEGGSKYNCLLEDNQGSVWGLCSGEEGT